MDSYEIVDRCQEASGEWKVVRLWTGKLAIIDPYGNAVDPLDAPVGVRNTFGKYR